MWNTVNDARLILTLSIEPWANVVCPHWKCADDAPWCSHEKNVRVCVSGEVVLCTHWDNFVETFRMYQCSLCTSGSQHEVLRQISSTDIVPESFSVFNDCKESIGISGTGLAISSTAFNWSFSLSSFHFKIHRSSFPNYFSVLVKVALQGCLTPSLFV